MRDERKSKNELRGTMNEKRNEGEESGARGKERGGREQPVAGGREVRTCTTAPITPEYVWLPLIEATLHITTMTAQESGWLAGHTALTHVWQQVAMELYMTRGETWRWVSHTIGRVTVREYFMAMQHDNTTMREDINTSASPTFPGLLTATPKKHILDHNYIPKDIYIIIHPLQLWLFLRQIRVTQPLLRRYPSRERKPGQYSGVRGHTTPSAAPGTHGSPVACYCCSVNPVSVCNSDLRWNIQLASTPPFVTWPSCLHHWMTNTVS